jgi:hypothetical protein
MSETEMNLPTQSAESVRQIEALQRQVFLLLLALVVLSATLVFYLFCESHFRNRELEEFRAQEGPVIQAWSKNQQAIKAIHQELSNYGLTHPNFQPVLRKYGWTPPATAPRQ